MAEREEDVGLTSRVLKAGSILADAHLSIARQEARRDAERVGAGVALLAVAALLIGCALVLLHVVGVVALSPRLGIGRACLALAGLDFVVAMLLGLVARSRLAAPVLGETRAMLRRTASALRDG